MIGILDRITQQRLLRNWTEYELAQRSELPDAVKLLQLLMDITGAHAMGVQGEHFSPNPGDVPLVFGDEFRFEFPIVILKLFSEIICRICSFATGIKILLFDKNLHILILTKKEPFLTKNTIYFTLPRKF